MFTPSKTIYDEEQRGALAKFGAVGEQHRGQSVAATFEFFSRRLDDY
jgi:hypothetical protein